jgi:exo-1,4-beta-D-glucosaminidase
MNLRQFTPVSFPSVLAVVLAGVMLAPFLRAETVPPLHSGWQLQSSSKLNATGKEISSPGFSTKDWIKTTVPNTVVAAQVAAGIFPDPYFGDNLRKLPGMDYKIGAFYSNLPMPKSSPYASGWWYRDEFVAPVTAGKRYYWLRFNGINYKADIWLNGHEIADSTQIAGANRRYDLNVTKYLKPGKRNVLAVEVWAPTPHDLAFTFVDWNPMPPDKDMGLWGKVNLVSTGPISLQFPMAATHFPDISKLNLADLTVYAQLQNATDRPVQGVVSGTAAGARFEQTVSLAPHQKESVTFSPTKFTQLQIHNPELWWPRQMGTPHLQRLTISVRTDSQVSDEQSVHFGIREITSELTAHNARLFRINGKPILIRGGGWTQDMLLRHNPERLQREFKLVRHLNLNTLRLEGQMVPNDFFNLADKNGILVFPGWVCCSEWQDWGNWTPQTLEVAKASLRSQISRLRSHPSILVWLNGSDIPPVENVEKAYLQIEAELHWPNPIISSATATPTAVTGESGVKMTGPYNYVEPSYWDVDTEHGGAYGFNTETSPGPSIPSLASRKKFLSDPMAWPPTAAWKLHYGGGDFTSMDVLNRAMDAMFTTPSSLAEYVRMADTMEYNSERAMFESYSGNKYVATGVIQWMLNNAWPSMYWHLYDYYLDPDASYYGAKKACQPLHIQYTYNNHAILVVNSTYHPAVGMHASVTVHDVHWHELYSAEAVVNAAADSSQAAFTLPEKLFSGTERLFLINLKLTDASGKVVSRNFYWVPYRLTDFDWSATTYTHTPAKFYPDLTALTHLPQATVTAHAQIEQTPRGKVIRLQLKNTSQALAFQLRFVLRTPSGDLIAPVIWSDDWIELTPGESRTFTTATLPADTPGDAVVKLSGWNISSATITPVSSTVGSTSQQ